MPHRPLALHRPPWIRSVIRSKAYIGALVFAAILGIPISAIAYGFLALVAAIQHYLFTDLPNQVLGSPPPAWWPVPWLVLLRSARCSARRSSAHF
jgi:hypothetical protein